MGCNIPNGGPSIHVAELPAGGFVCVALLRSGDRFDVLAAKVAETREAAREALSEDELRQSFVNFVENNPALFQTH